MLKSANELVGLSYEKKKRDVIDIDKKMQHTSFCG